jgi:hypothetical protein
LKLVPPAAEDGDVVAALAEIATLRTGSAITLSRSFTRREMAARTRWFYPQILRSRRTPGEGLWLITNNFSTGGAQSSARRLLVGLAARGIKVRAAVVEEHPSHPTAVGPLSWPRACRVLAVPPPVRSLAPESVARILAAINADRPRAILFWNLIPVFKILLRMRCSMCRSSMSAPAKCISLRSPLFSETRPALAYLERANTARDSSGSW